MALHTEISIDLAVYGSSVKENCAFCSKITDRIVDDLDQESSGRVKLAGAESDVELSFQSVTTGHLIVLKSIAAFEVKFNGTGNPAIAVTPRTRVSDDTVTPGFLAMLVDSITSVHLTNLNATEAIEVDFGIAGL